MNQFAIPLSHMRAESVRAILKVLSNANVRFLVAGGLAVNAHGVVRFTHDVDLVIQLVPERIRCAFDALLRLGYRPSVPVTAEQFADEATRKGWIEEKGMQVLNFWSDQHQETPLDVFVTEPFLFDAEYERATVRALAGMEDVRFVSLQTLLQMKEAANRKKDQGDIEDLRLRLKEEPKVE